MSGVACCRRVTSRPRLGAWAHNSISAKSCSKAASWITAASWSCRCTAKAKANRAARWARRITWRRPSRAGPLPASVPSSVGCGPKSRKNGVMPSITKASVAVSASDWSRPRRSAATWRSSFNVISGSDDMASASRWASAASSLQRHSSMASAVADSTGISRCSKARTQPSTSRSAALMKGTPVDAGPSAVCSAKAMAYLMRVVVIPYVGKPGPGLERFDRVGDHRRVTPGTCPMSSPSR